MVGEIDKTAEARRKALRNGEEDPVVVAQRFLNIYRQMHIFSPERKEAFNKMLLELSPDIQGLFSSLPGGAMLQDYVDDLIKEKGGKPGERTNGIASGGTNASVSNETSQQAEILATALAKAQSQVNPSGITAGPSKISMDKDFAEEFAKIVGLLLEKQTISQKESLEKITADINKTQLFLAKNFRESKEEQHQDLNTLIKNMTDIYQAERERQRQELGEICKTIAQSQTALSLSMGGQPQVQASANSATQNMSSGMDIGITKKLIDMFVEGQKQLNSRLEKVEIAANSKVIENEKLLKAFEQTQTAMMQKIQENSALQATENLPSSRDDEKLVKMITESQENLVRILLGANFQQNNTAQSNNNANNIQITTSDNSVQTALLLDKIISMQNSNQQSLEKALVAAIKEQGEVYNKISAKQTKELAAIIAESLKNIQPVYVPTNIQKPPEKASQKASFNTMEPTQERQENNIVSKEEDGKEQIIEDFSANKNDSEIEQENSSKKKKKKKKKKQQEDNKENNFLEEVKKTTAQTEPQKSQQVSSSLPEGKTISQQKEILEKKDTKDKNKSELTTNNTFEKKEKPQGNPKESAKNDFSWLEEIEQKGKTEDFNSDWGFFSNESETDKKQQPDDWGFSIKDDNKFYNDNKKEKLNKKNDIQKVDSQEATIEAIGNNSYIGISNSYEQQSEPSMTSRIKPVEIKKMPIIYDDREEDEIDPYQNSILKD